ncbi:hypothetical protein [Microcoleus sp. PH2017_30_WIL_O_A]|uniref:hypothetical protein n=1 Tax=Microcoleus sp. PH2017_30_WIL_O_A TaxID=2798840 RepID=UPI001D901BA3|nr:hypothetical protein [Microcoleus sp. PH2017_30_WIL_O_A]MCC3586819.1 hypothetical protein [Microcoleus sp. PH2017_30_WIL_O_A]
MPLDFYEQQPSPSVRDTKANGDAQELLTTDEVMAGTKVIMTHAQRQAFLKTSRLGEIFGVAHLLPEIEDLAHKVYEELVRMSLVRDRLRINIFTFKTQIVLLTWLLYISSSEQDDRTE